MEWYGCDIYGKDKIVTNHPLTINEIEAIKVQKASGRTYNAIAKMLGRDPKTIKRCCLEPRNAEERKAIRQQITSNFEDLAIRMLTSVSDENISKLSALQKVTAGAICTDKVQLLRGQPTERIDISAVRQQEEDLDIQIEELEQKIYEITRGNPRRKLRRERVNIIEAEAEVRERDVEESKIESTRRK